MLTLLYIEILLSTWKCAKVLVVYGSKLSNIKNFFVSFYKMVSIFLSLLTLINDCLIIITVIQCKVLLKEITLGNIPYKVSWV